MGISNYSVSEHYKICTSSTRPSGSFIYEGLMIYETDTDRVMVWNGTAWRFISGITPSARYQKTTTQSIPHGVVTVVAFTSAMEVYDTASLGNNDSRFTVPAGFDGLWAMGGNFIWATSSAGDRAILIGKNGSGSRLVQSEIGATTTGPISGYEVATEARLVAGDYIELFAFQTTGGALSIDGSANPINFWCSYRGMV